MAAVSRQRRVLTDHLDLWHLSDCSSLLSGTKLRSDTSSDMTAVETFITHPHENTDSAKSFTVADEG